MVKKCSIKTCKIEWRPNGDVTFHKFPLKKPDLLKKWMQAIPGDQKFPTKYDFICSQHFSEDSFNNFTLERRRLISDAVPNVFSDNVETSTHAKDEMTFYDETQPDIDMKFDVNSVSIKREIPSPIGIMESEEQGRLINNEIPKDFPDFVETSLLVKNETDFNDDTKSEVDMKFDITSVSVKRENPSPIPSPPIDEEPVQFCDVGVQVSPRRLKPTDRELELRGKIKIMQQRLRRRELKLDSIRKMLDILSRKQTTNLEEVSTNNS